MGEHQGRCLRGAAGTMAALATTLEGGNGCSLMSSGEVIQLN